MLLKEKYMLRASIQILEDFEEDLGAEKIGNSDELRAWSTALKKKVEIIADTLDKLEKRGWRWTTGSRDIILYKNILKVDAQKEIKTLKIPEGIVLFD